MNDGVEATIIERHDGLLVYLIGDDPQQYLVIPACRHKQQIVYVQESGQSVTVYCPNCGSSILRDVKPRKTLEELIGPCPFDPSESTARRRKSGATTHAWYRSRGW